MGRDAAQDALSDLMKWSLVEFNVETRRYRLHDLARLFTKARLSEVRVDETDAAQRRFALHYQTVIASCNSLYLEGNESMLRGLTLFDQEWDNIQAGQSWAEARIEKDQVAAQLCMDYPNVGYYVLDLRQHPRERIQWLEVQLAAAQKLKRRDIEGYALGNLGLAWADLGEGRKAIEFHEQHLNIAREIGDRKDEGGAFGNLGRAWAILGETRRAIEFHEQSRNIAREIGNRRGEAYALGNLGLAWAVLGETCKAIESFEQVLSTARETGDRMSEGAALGSLGLAWADLGETRKAIEFFEQSRAIAREIGDRRVEGNSLFNMSLSVDKLGDRAQAMTLAEAALKIFEKIESPTAEKARRQLAEWRGQAK
jgi:tetratricopeptide (TPR) repeat protein